MTEFILTFLLMTAIFGTAVDDRAPGMKLGGFAIGLTVAFDILAAGPVTGASMNPARSFGPALVHGIFELHWCYWVAPIAGAVVAAQLYHHFLLEPPAKHAEQRDGFTSSTRELMTLRVDNFVLPLGGRIAARRKVGGQPADSHFDVPTHPRLCPALDQRANWRNEQGGAGDVRQHAGKDQQKAGQQAEQSVDEPICRHAARARLFADLLKCFEPLPTHDREAGEAHCNHPQDRHPPLGRLANLDENENLDNRQQRDEQKKIGDHGNEW